MKTRHLGTGGPEVSAIGLGGMYLSIKSLPTGEGRPSPDEAVRTIHAALDRGVTLVDTADVYCFDDGDIGHNERLIARALRERSDGGRAVVVATKGGLRRPGGAWTRDASPAHLASACEASLRALGRDVIDVYQLHAPDPNVPFADSVGALARLREQGKVRHVGLSNVSVEQLAAARAVVPIVSVQNRWSPMDRTAERDGVLSACTETGVAFLPYSPFGGARASTTLKGLGSLARLASERGVSPHRLVLAWMLAKSPVVIPIPGARRVESVVDSAAAGDLSLSAAEVADVERSFAS